MAPRPAVAAAGAIGAAGLLYIALPWTLKLALRRRFLARVARRGAVCLTFDDGPDPASTPAVLDALRHADVKATFFLIGENVDEHPELARAIVDAGHDVGEHSALHTHAWRTGPVRTLRDLAAGGRAVDGLRPPDAPRLFRPPYGKLNLASVVHLARGGRRAIFWNANPRDYVLTAADEVAARATELLRPGAVVLLHDRASSRTGEPVTAQALPAVLDALRERGLEALRVSDVLA